jgi:catechol 2,3-dioxygenase-like lactoylglutathione lyase family enzyme
MKAEKVEAQTESAPASTPVSVKKLGHVVFRVRDIEESVRFWTEIMGFRVSDRNEHGMVFLRCGPDHHTVGLARATEERELPSKSQPGFDHCAFEVESVAQLFKIRDFLRQRGVPIVFEGRRGAGCNIGIEFKDPNGYLIEVYAGMDQIGWDGKSRPMEQWRRASSLEEAVANPVPGAKY